MPLLAPMLLSLALTLPRRRDWNGWTALGRSTIGIEIRGCGLRKGGAVGRGGLSRRRLPTSSRRCRHNSKNLIASWQTCQTIIFASSWDACGTHRNLPEGPAPRDATEKEWTETAAAADNPVATTNAWKRTRTGLAEMNIGRSQEMTRRR